MLLAMPWRPALAILGCLGVVLAAVIYGVAPRHEHGAAQAHTEANFTPEPRRRPYAFPLLFCIGVIDTATRMAFLLFLPFLLCNKGASEQTIGLALTLVFAGGAAGKLACTFIGARIGAVGTVWLTEGSTALGILALFPLPLFGALLLLPLMGVALNGTSSVLYGSVPDLVPSYWRTRALSIFYTGVIGAGAISPVLFGRLGDALGVLPAMTCIAGFVLLTLPLSALLRRALTRA